MAKKKTHNSEFEKLSDNEKLTVSYMISLKKKETPERLKQIRIAEEKLTPITDEKVLAHLDKIADGYLGRDVNFGSSRKGSSTPREKLVENSINFEL